MNVEIKDMLNRQIAEVEMPIEQTIAVDAALAASRKYPGRCSTRSRPT